MPPKPILLSIARIADLATKPFEFRPLDRESWQTGDYVVGEVVADLPAPCLELCNGRMVEAVRGDLVVGALGTRTATLEVVGDWRSIESDGRMQALTAAGLLGRATSVSRFITPFVNLNYRGHLMRNGNKLRMKDFMPETSDVSYDCPTILLIGTSMSSGKTTSAKIIIRELKRAGLKVVGAKFTGAARYRDILTMADAGADAIFDFVDVGLPSTVCSASEYRPALASLLRMIASIKPDVVVAEAGASPLEPYNGDVAIELIRPQISWTVLCASDPYAVVGVTQGFGFEADLVTGVAASTTAGIDVIAKLTGIRALNLLRPESQTELCEILRERIKM